MWPRQIQLARRCGNASIIAAGCGSWMTSCSNGLKPLDEAEVRAAVGPVADLELVREGPDDRDAEPAFRELVRGRAAPCVRRLEALAAIPDLDHEAIGVELVEDLDEALAARVGVAHGVRARLGQG